MTPNKFSSLALWLMDGPLGLRVTHVEDGNADIFGNTEEPGPLFAAHDDLSAGDAFGALERLGVVIRLASQPVDPPTSGRRRLERHLAATRQREDAGRLAQIARVLVLDGIKATPPSVIAADRSRATSATTTPITGA